MFLCVGAIAAVNFLEFQKKKQMISGFPKGSTQEDTSGRDSTYKESKKDDPNKEADKKDASAEDKATGETDVKPKVETSSPTLNLTVSGADDVNDYDFIHNLWLYLLFHAISLGVSFHKPLQSGMIVIWAYLHAITFGAYMFLHVSFPAHN